jgi:rRNA-processing protein FCF1
MNIIVNDANIIFDIIEIDLTGFFFQLKYKFLITDFVYNEIEKFEQKKLIEEYIQKDSLVIYEIDDIEKIYEKNQKNPNISAEDCSVLIAAVEKKAMILTGDKSLRQIAEKEGTEVHGILWVFDTLIDNEIISDKLAIDKLTKLMKLNIRLPFNECQERLKKWGNKLI